MAPRDAGARAIIPLTPYQVNVSYGQSGTRDMTSGWFGPLQPMAPAAPPDVQGRRFDYPVGWNINVRPRTYERIGFPELRALADNYDLLRLVIETRKDQIESRPWSIKPNADMFGPGKAKPTKALLDRCREIQTFFRKPDKSTGFKPWLRQLLEDLFVIDAPAIYRRPTRGGGVFGYEVIDGGTIVPKIDDSGRIAMYQQVLKGLPAVDYTKDQIIYRPRNVRSNKIYGFSPVEQIIMTVNIALRRQVWQLQYWTEGNVPDALIGVPETWTPDQIAQFQTWWDSVFEGDTAQRRHGKFVPSGVGKTFIQTKEPELKNALDEWLARIVCFCFSISPQAFSSQVNRATAQTAKESSLEEGLAPTLDWVADLFNDLIIDDFKEPDVEFAWGSHEKADPTDEETILSGYVKSAVMRPNEARERLGLDPDPDPNADKLGTITANGFVPIEISAAPPQASPDMTGGENGVADAAGADGKSGDGKLRGGGAGGNSRRGAGGAGAGADHQGVGKSADAPFAKRRRRIKPLKPTRKAAVAAAVSLRDIITPVLAKTGKSVIAEVRSKLSGFAKADEDEDERQRKIVELAAAISEEVDLSGLDVLADVTVQTIETFVKETSGRVLAQLGVFDQSDLVDQVNERAVEMASERAAELVGKKWVDGELVDNPNAEFAITESTRDMIRRAIATGLDDNVGLDDIAQSIEDLGFSKDRADLIARTEIARANSDAALESYGAAEKAGVSVMKEWILGPNPCPICEDNADDGVIAIDDEFSSGDDAPPAHPNCECAVSPVVEDGGDNTDDTDE